jgi:hypothetical protein
MLQIDAEEFEEIGDALARAGMLQAVPACRLLRPLAQ